MCTIHMVQILLPVFVEVVRETSKQLSHSTMGAIVLLESQ
jgi:hypothetical protein